MDASFPKIACDSGRVAGQLLPLASVGVNFFSSSVDTKQEFAAISAVLPGSTHFCPCWHDRC